MTSMQIMGKLPSKIFNKEVDFENDAIKFMLLNESATPAIDSHIYISDLSEFEISGGDYIAGGETISNQSINLDTTNNQIIFESDNVTFSNLSDTIRYGILYDSDTDVIIGYFDLESDTTISGSDLNFNIPDSVLYKINTFQGVLDGNTNCVYTFCPFTRLKSSYTDELIQVQDTTTDETRYFGYDVDGNLETSEILSWLNGNDGAVIWVANQVKTANPTYQSTVGYAPKIAISGAIQTDGLKFDGTDDFMKADDYSEIQITSRPMSIYFDYTRGSLNSYILSKNLDSAGNMQYGIYDANDGNFQFFLEGENRVITAYSSTNKVMCLYHSEFDYPNIVTSSNANIATSTFTSSLTNRSQFRIGCRDNTGDTNSHFNNGYIKTVLIFNNAYRNYYYYLSNSGI